MRRVVVLLLVTVALVEAQVPRVALPPPPISRWYIHVVNGLSNNVDLLVHCQSKNDDLGIQHLVHGADFQWNFKMNFWGTTLFWCFLSKPGAKVSFESFWPESKHSWLHHRCANGRDGTCIWTAKDDGIYLRNIPDNVDELIHNWEL